MAPIDRGEFRDAIATVRADIQGVHERLDVLNGRTRQNEQDVAVLQERVTQGAKASAAVGRWWTRLAGSAAAAAIALLLEHLFRAHP